MNLIVVGISHQRTPVAVRERLAFSPAEIGPASARVVAGRGAAEACLLATCNRVEVYAAFRGDSGATPEGETPDALGGEADPAGVLCDFLAQERGVPRSLVTGHAFIHRGDEAARHLFRVAAALDSLVLGETQVLGQVRDALAAARESGAAGRWMNELFDRSLFVARRVRTETGLGQGRVSVSSVAVDFAHGIFGDLAGRAALIVGAGAMGEATLTHLVARGVSRVVVTSRSPEAAARLAARFGGTAAPFESLPSLLAGVDIVISQTAAPHAVIRREVVAPALARRRGNPVFFIDIAVPRDVEESVGDLDDVYLYNIDDLQRVVDRTIAARRAELEAAGALVDQEVAKFSAACRVVDADPAIRSLISRLDETKRAELTRTLARLPGLSDGQRAEVAEFADRLAGKFLHPPLSHLKEEVRNGGAGPALWWFRRLFGV